MKISWECLSIPSGTNISKSADIDGKDLKLVENLYWDQIATVKHRRES